MFPTFERLFHVLIRTPRLRSGISLYDKQTSLLRLLAVAHREQLDLAKLIGNLASEYPGAYGRRLHHFQRWIAADSSVAAALSHNPGVLDADDALAIQCGSATGLLRETYEDLLRHREPSLQNASANIIRSAFFYSVAIAFFTLLILTLVMIFIVPSIAAIFDEFAMELPPPMLTLVALCEGGAVYLPIMVLVFVVCLAAIVSSDPQRWISRTRLRRFWPSTSTQYSASLLRLVALPTEIGCAIGPTLTAAAQYHPDQVCRRRLLDVRTRSKTESELWLNLSRHRLIEADYGEQIVRISDPSVRAWTLRSLSKSLSVSGRQRAEFLARMIQYVPVILLGLLVGWIVIALLQTLSRLSLSLA